MATSLTLTPFRRAYLIATPDSPDGQYRVEDKLTGAVYLIGEEEHFLLTQCDGRQSVEEIAQAYAEHFGRRLGLEEFREFLGRLEEARLLDVDPRFWKHVDATWWHSNPRDCVREREDAIERTTDPRLKKYRRFFWEYDRCTHPLLLDLVPEVPDDEKPLRKRLVVEAVKVLPERILRRAEYFRGGRVPAAGELPAPANEQTVPYLSRVQLDLIRKWLPTADGRIDADAHAEAFEMFANGELRVTAPSMPGPSESNRDNFSFGEFAFLAIEQGVDVEEWSRLLNGLVREQRIFLMAYRPDTPEPHSYSDYRPANWREGKQVNEAFKRGLRQRYARLSVAELAREAGRNAADAFPAGWRA